MSLEEYDMKKVALLLAGILLLFGTIIGSGVGFYFYSKYKNTEKVLSASKSLVSENPDELLAKVGKLIKLPAGEIPQIAIISDLSPLKNNAFFSNAKVGDRLLIFNNAKKAILYDPVENKIVEVGPLIIPTPTAATSSASITPPGRIIFRGVTPTYNPISITPAESP